MNEKRAAVITFPKNQRSTELPAPSAMACRLHEDQVKEAIRDWERDGYGFINKKKKDGTVRFYLEQTNSLGVGRKTKCWKPGAIDYLRERLQVDVLGLLEHQTNWRMVARSLQFHELLGRDEQRVSVAASNVHSGVFNLHGGVAMMAFGRIVGYATTGKDKTGLARWVWMVFDSGHKRTRVVTGYRPNDKSSLLDSMEISNAVWRQHYDYYREH